jgi:HD superfamily phosphodiesterase
MSSILSSDSECLWATRGHVIKAREYVLVQKAAIDDLALEGASTREAKLRLAMLEEILRILEGEYALIEKRTKIKNHTTTNVRKTMTTRIDTQRSSLQRFTA